MKYCSLLISCDTFGGVCGMKMVSVRLLQMTLLVVFVCGVCVAVTDDTVGGVCGMKLVSVRLLQMTLLVVCVG